MESNLSYNTIGLPNLPLRTKISLLRVGVWQFIDPESLGWTQIDENTSEFRAVGTYGIVLSSSRFPEQYVDKILPGETIIRDSSDSRVVTYYKKPDEEIL